MRRGGGVPAALLLSISWLVQALVVGACFDIFQCFDGDYPKCNYTAAGDRVNVSIVARENSTVDGGDFSVALAALVCYQRNSSSRLPLCWQFLESNASPSALCNSTLAEVAILEQVEGSLQSALPREALVDLLQSSGSYFAAVGIRVSIIESQSAVNGLFDVPVASWISVGVGVLLSLTILAKPVWWDRIVLKCWHQCRQS